MSVHTKQQFYSDRNSTTTALDNGEVFTGAWEDAERYADTTVSVSTDQNGTYSVQYSPDGVNQDSTLTRYYRTDQINVPHRFTNARRYVRVVFTNDSGSNQTYLRLQTSMGNRQPLNAPMDGALAHDYDAVCVRPSSYNEEVALGLREERTLWNKFGYNNDVDAGTEIVAAFGGTWTTPTTASTLSVVSSSTADDAVAVGTGAWTIRIFGTDANHLAITEDVTLDGQVTVTPTTNSFFGVNRVAVLTAGTGQVNAGTITITRVTGGATVATIPAGEGTTQQMIFHTAADHTGLAEFLMINANKSGGGSPYVTIKGWVFSHLSGVKYQVFNTAIDTNVENTIVLMPPLPFVIGEQSCLWFEATTDTANTVVTMRMSLIEVRSAEGTS